MGEVPSGDSPHRGRVPSEAEAMTLVSIGGAADVLGITPRAARGLHESGKLIPEAVVSGVAVWSVSTLKLWDEHGRPPGVLPPVHPPEVYGVGDIAERLGTSVAWVKQKRWYGELPPPTWTVGAGTMVWSAEAFEAAMPWCGNHRVEIVDTECKNGTVCRVRCACGEWVELRLNGCPT